jgi:hypothetical protein
MKTATNNIKVMTGANAAAGAKRKGDSFLQVVKPPKAKPVNNTMFYRVTMNGLTVDAQGKEERASGFFTIENVKIQAVRDASKAEGAAKLAKPSIAARLSALSPDDAFFIRALQDAWLKRVNENLTKPDPEHPGETIMDLSGGRKIHDIGQWTFSQRTTVKDKDGKLLKGAPMVDEDGNSDPIMRWKLQFDKIFHEKCPYGILRGKPKCVIRDGSKPIVENGKKTFALATVNVDGVEQPINAKNVHLFITAGSTLIKGRWMFDSASQSDAWITPDISMIEAVILPGGGEGGFDDDEIVDDTTLDATVDEFSVQERPVATAHVTPIDSQSVKNILDTI